jgi:hypothetical protein
MWPIRGPKASQKEPMAIREKHVPATVRKTNAIMRTQWTVGRSPACASDMHLTVGQPGAQITVAPVIDAMAAPLASVLVKLMSCRMTAGHMHGKALSTVRLAHQLITNRTKASPSDRPSQATTQRRVNTTSCLEYRDWVQVPEAAIQTAIKPQTCTRDAGEMSDTAGRVQTTIYGC